MKPFVICDESGRIIRKGVCQDHLLEQQVMSAGETAYESATAGVDTHYLQDGVFLEIPTQSTAEFVFDYVTKQWIDPRTINDYRNTKWIEIKQARDETEFSGFIWDGSMFDSTSISQSRIQGASQLATLAVMNAQPFSIDWTLADNTIRTLSAQDMLAVGQALGVHINTQHGKARQKRVEINAATTVEEIMAISW